MQSIRTHLTIIFLMFSLGSQTAFAGALSNKLIERRQAQQQDNSLDASDASTGKTSLPSAVKLVKDFAYGSDTQQRMDIYHLPHASGAPVLFMVHGGAWRFGDKANKAVVENKVARWVPKGFIFISVNYRMLPNTDPLHQAEDVARALAVAQANAAEWGGDPAKFILMGHSAGAHLVALLAASPAKATELGAQPWLGTISLDSAALDVVQIMERKHYRLYDQAFGKDKTYWKSVSPIHKLSAYARPILIMCSSTRPDQPCVQAHRFEQEAKSLGVRVWVLEQAMTHKQINQMLGLKGDYTDAVEVFMGSLDASVKKILMPESAEGR